jgi:diazepam-binding inhibitor (GABA receptor modulating acyl-CoA-binding protein)
MSDLRARFDAAVEEVQGLPQKPDNDELLTLYSLFKQATEGDVTGKRPGMLDFVKRAKHDAWAGRKGMATEAAMQEYVDVVVRLQAKYGG